MAAGPGKVHDDGMDPTTEGASMAMTPENVREQADRMAIDTLMAAFYQLFCNLGGARPDLARIYDLFIPEGLIIKHGAGVPAICNLEQFIAPRERLLTDGTLADFQEEEVASRTEVFGNLAQRISLYRKSGRWSGVPFQARGVKTTQLIRTGAGWRISALAWDDEREGFRVPEPGAGWAPARASGGAPTEISHDMRS